MGFAGTHVADERPYAKLAAQKFGTQHYEMTITADDFAAFMPRYVWHMEEPVCEPPAIALYYVSKLAREHVTVLLSGEGGDEAFAGYSNYRNLVWLERINERLASKRSRRQGAQIGRLAVSMRTALGKNAPLMTDAFPGYYYSRTSNPYRFTGNRLGEVYASDFALQSTGSTRLNPFASSKITFVG